jgi:hypothetical protein
MGYGLVGNDFLGDLAASAQNLHLSGSLSPRVLRAIVRHLADVEVQHSVETGSGASTLLFSHLSRDHTVFAVDGGSGSISNVKSSALLDPSTTKFVEGPTQITLPAHRFCRRLQAALLDGPHAFPFPALEYYYIYPHLDEGALLILDDIHIRSVHDFFRFLRADEMFRLIAVVERTAFFRRTASAPFDPFGDGWPLQGYNNRLLMRFVWWERTKSAVPPRIRRSLKGMWRRIYNSPSY